MKISDTKINSIFGYIKGEIGKMHHGRIILEVNETSDKVYVVTENREQFEKTEKESFQGNRSEARNG